MKTITVPAKIDNLEEVTNFVDCFLEENDCSLKAQTQIDVVIDEIFHNIVSYAYQQDGGDVTIQIENTESCRIVLTFKDMGVPFDPLKSEDPDITLDAQQREIGGLGIYMVKKMMDNVSYEYCDGQNILVLEKNLAG